MKQLWVFAPMAGLLLGSATPPQLLSLDPPRLEYQDVDCTQAGPDSCTALAEGAGETVARGAETLAVENGAAVPDPLLPELKPAPLAVDQIAVAKAAPVEPPVAAEPKEVAAPEGREDKLRQDEPAAKRPGKPGGVRVVVSIPQQKAYVFEDGELLATSPVSTGKPGHATPVGTFRILQKKVHHKSNRYANAPMPYMQRLTNYGIALHAGKLPGYPASHGCIRLPWSFAKKLYGITDFGTKVTVTSRRPKSANEALTLA